MPACSARADVASLRPDEAQITVCPPSRNAAPTAAPISPGWSTPIVTAQSVRWLEGLDSRNAGDRAVRSSEDNRPVLVHEDAVLEVRLHGAREHHSLDVAADPLELLDRLAVRHAGDVLLDDRAGIEFFCDVVGCRPDDLDSAVARSPVRIRADEGR